MAIFHCQFSIISRSQGKSSVGASAYRAGEKLYNERDGMEHDYIKKTGVVYKEILTPDNAPEWAKDRSKLWNEVEKIEKSKNSQLAREVNIALPTELNRGQQIELLKGYIKDNFTSKGMVADLAIHDKADGNPHAHVMLTVRPFEKDGTWGAKAKKEYILDQNGQKIKQGKEFKSKKIETTDWNKKENIEKWREQWANHTNRALEKANVKERIDHRSYQERGIDKVATIHEGHKVRAMESRGIKTEIGSYNKQAAEKNKMLELVERQINIYEKQKGELEHGRIKSNGITNGAIGGKGHSTNIGTEYFFGKKSRGNDVFSSRVEKPITIDKGHIESSETGQRGINKEASREREDKPRVKGENEPYLQGNARGNQGIEERQLSETRADSKERIRGIDQEPRQQQGAYKASNGTSISSKEHTQPELEGEGKAILNTTTVNSRSNSSSNRGISTSPLDDVLKALESSVQKVFQEEKEMAEKEARKLEKQMKKPQKSKGQDWDIER